MSRRKDCAVIAGQISVGWRSMMNAKISVVMTTIVGALTCLGGCEASDLDAERTTLRADTCPQWKCGFNAAEVNGRSLQELNLAGLPNADGVRIVGFTPPPLALLGGYSLAVENDELVAKRFGSKLRGSQLIGSIILVQTAVGVIVPVTIAGVSQVASWATGGAPIVAYTLITPELNSLLGVRNVCSGSLLDPLAAAVTVLGGETYDGALKTVNAGMTGWFTLACAGSAAAKIKLLGYGPQSQFPGAATPASPAARQATLKMVTADYCGTGHSYTANGTPLVWANKAGTVDSSDLHTPGDVEAIWTTNGALCLDATRIAASEVDCELPTCEGRGVLEGEWITHLALD
jgi:hypothetical protein